MRNNLRTDARNKMIFSFLTFLLALVVFGGACTFSVSAGSVKKKKALIAYEKILSQERIRWKADEGEVEPSYVDAEGVSFALAYLNNDKIPELLIWSDADCTIGATTGHALVYTCKGAKAKYAGRLYMDSGKNKTVYYPKKGIIKDYCDSDMQGNNRYYYQFNGTKLKDTDLYVVNKLDSESGKNEYYIGSEQVSKQEFTEYLRENYTGKTGTKKFRWYINSQENRDRYLK